MRLTRSATKHIAAIAAENNSIAEAAGHETSRFLDLPAELRCLVFSFSFEDEPPELRGDIDRSSTTVKDPGVAFVSRQIRAEVLPIFYSRKAFFFNVTPRGNHHKIKKWVASMKTTPAKMQYMKKVTFFGRSWGGQVGITIDFATSQIIDARWRMYQQKIARGLASPELEHHHMGVGHCARFQAALDAAMQGDLVPGRPRAYQAMLNILEACHGHFMIQSPNNSMVHSFARKPPRLGEQSFGPCYCSQIVALVGSR
jgi:hypothetical protein